REASVQPVARLSRLAVAEAVRQDEVVARRVERLPLAKQLAREHRTACLLAHQALAFSGGAVEDEHRVANDALVVALRLAERAVVEAHLGQGLAGSEAEVFEDVIARSRLGIVGGP